MGLLRKIINKGKLVFVPKNERFYYDLFVQGRMSSPNPYPVEDLRLRHIKSLIESLNLSLPLKICDVGSGRGWLANELREYGKVIGLEPVASVVKYAKKIFPDIEFHAGELNDLSDSFQLEFDLVVSSEVLEHIPYLQQAEFINDLGKIGKRESYLILTTPRKEVMEDHTGTQPVEDWVNEQELGDLISTHFEILRHEAINVQEIDQYQIVLAKKKT